MKKKEISKVALKLWRQNEIMGGEWCLYRTRIPLKVVLFYLEKGNSIKALKTEIWPHLKRRKVIL